MLRGETEPRVFTPPLRELDEQTSLGFAFCEWCEEVCHVELVPWQRWLAVHGLEVVGDFETGWSFRFRTVVVLIGRQNGKSLFAELLALFFMYVLEVNLVLGTAQTLDTAEEVWDAAIERAESHPDMAARIARIKRVNGGKSFELDAGQRYKVVAATRKGARGKRSDLVIMDELREQEKWDGWSAVSKTTIAKPNAMLWAFSNAGDASSVVLRHERMVAHRALGDPDGIAAQVLGALPDPEDEDGTPAEVDDALALFEWSAEPGCAVDDPDGWAQANPSLGYGFVTERALRHSATTDPEPEFRTECLCQWVEAVARSPFPDGAWEAYLDGESREDADAPLFWGLDMSADRAKTALAFVGQRSDGAWHGEVEAYRPGFDWALRMIAKACAKQPMVLALQGRGASISSHIGELEAVEGLELVLCEGRDVGAWCGRFYDAVCAAENGSQPLYHIPQPALDYAAQVAQTRPLGDSAWGWDRRNSDADISPLVALTMAYGLATTGRTEGKVYASAYMEHGVRTV